MAGLVLLDGMTMLVKYVSMWSMAGITVGRLGVPREKYAVASLRIFDTKYIKHSIQI